MPTIVVSPVNVVNFSEGGGHFWVYMQYVQGLRALGCDVYWLECFRSAGSRDADARRVAPFLARLERFGLGGKVILYPTDGRADAEPATYLGLEADEAESILEQADLLVNFHYAIHPRFLARFRRTALVDIDPGLLQFWISRGQLRVPRHDVYFTTGETVGTRAALFPDCGVCWIHIPPPICLEHWPSASPAEGEAFTTVSNWDADDWIVDETEVYENTKRVAFLEYADLAGLTRQPLELALHLRTARDAEEGRDLQRRGWRVRLATEVAGTPEAYQSYIRRSRGEFSCAKPSCVKLQNAWVSDRTLCYLASGKPVVVQHTGPSALLPDGEGMFRFSTLEQAAAALAAVNGDYERHSHAARRIAEEHFDARKILADLLARAIE